MIFNKKNAANPFVNKVLTVLSGNGLALVIPFLLAPIISRLFTPADIGSYELFARILALVSIVATLRFELALVLPGKESEALGLLKLGLRFLILFSVFSIFILLLFYEPIIYLLENEGLSGILMWLPIAILLTGGMKLCQNYAIRRERFSLLSANRILASAFNHGSKAALGLFIPTTFGLLLGHLIGLIAPVFHFLMSAKIRGAFYKSFSADTTGLFKKYRDFPIINSPHVFSDEIKNFGIFAIISIGYGEVVLGLFALTIRYLRVPVELFGSSIGSVFLQAASKAHANKQAFYPLLARVILFLFATGLVPFGCLFFFGEEIFSWFFGREWKDAGKYAAVISPWLFLLFVSSPVSSVPMIINRQKFFFVISLIMNTLVLIVAFYLMSNGYSMLDLIIGITLTHSIFLIILLLWFLRITRVIFNA